MPETYEFVAEFAQTWGLAYFVAVFAVVVIYTMWPASKDRFDAAALLPLRED